MGTSVMHASERIEKLNPEVNHYEILFYIGVNFNLKERSLNLCHFGYINFNFFPLNY